MASLVAKCLIMFNTMLFYNFVHHLLGRVKIVDWAAGNCALCFCLILGLFRAIRY